jgi:hypothetical protein
MKKLFINVVVFLIPFLILVIILPVDKRFKYQGLKDDCYNHGIWIYDRIFNNSKPIDIAFIGSSHTINGVNDKLISEKLNGTLAVNIAYCRLGRNLDYVLLKELLKGKKPEYVIFEVREEEDRYSHPIFPFMAETSDVVLANPFFNREIFSDIWTHFAYKIEITQDYIYKHNSEVPIRKNNFGFASPADTASFAKLEEIKQKRSIHKNELSDFEQNFHSNFSKGYLKKINEICKENGVEIIFLYLPSYCTNHEKPFEYKTYINYGKVLIPPNNIFDNPTNWIDENHLNRSGANKLSDWIAEEIKKLK